MVLCHHPSKIFQYCLYCNLLELMPPKMFFQWVSSTPSVHSSLVSDLGARKSWRSAKRSVDCLIDEQSTCWLTADWGALRIFHSFPEFLFLFTLDVRVETTRLQQTHHIPNALSFSQKWSRSSKLTEIKSEKMNVQFSRLLLLKHRILHINTLVKKTLLYFVYLWRVERAVLVLSLDWLHPWYSPHEKHPQSCSLIGHPNSVLISHWPRDLVSL